MLNEKIRELRKANRLTQPELAKALNVTKQCISNWEKDNIQPSVDMLVKIAKYFSVSTDYLLGLDERNVIDVSALNTVQIVHIQQIVNDLIKLM